MASIFTAGNIVAFIAGCLMLTGAFMNAVEKGRFKDDYKRWGYPRRMHLVTAALEALSAVLLFWPPTRLYGAILGALVMLAAIATVVRHREHRRAIPPIVYLVLLGAVIALN